MRFGNIIYTLLIGTLTIALSACSSEKPSYLEPHLATLPATDITRTEATLHGSVAVEGETDVPQLTFRYGTQEDMELSTPVDNMNGVDNKGAEGTPNGGNGNISLRLMNLRAGTTYYYTLQGSNGRTTTTSNTMSFTTLPNDKPSLGMASILSQGPMSVIVGYEITNDGGEDITETGCYFALGSDGEKQKIVADDFNFTAVKLRIGSLQRNATYQIWPYAANRVGETIGDAITLTTSDAITLAEAGELTTLMGENLYDYTTLSLAGEMNGDDLACLRRMMGRELDDSATPGELSDINMSDVKIVSGGGSYGASRYTQDGVIGQGLFAHCTQLWHVVLPSTATTLEKDAFLDCTSLRKIEIPASIATLLPSSGCTALEDIVVSKANTGYSSQDGVLLDANGTEIVWFPMGKKGTYTLPSTITKIGNYAFKECSIETFRFSDGLKEIGQGAFMNSKVREVDLPDNLRMLGTGTFQGCQQLQVVRLGSKAEKICEYAFDGCPLTDLYITSTYAPTLEPNAFATHASTSLFTSCTLHVPAGKKKWYQMNEPWKGFSKIVEN